MVTCESFEKRKPACKIEASLYTMDTYRALLEPAGFEIVKSAGWGSPFYTKLHDLILLVWSRLGFAAALPLFLLTWPLQILEYQDSKVPISLYVQCVKRPARS